MRGTCSVSAASEYAVVITSTCLILFRTYLSPFCEENRWNSILLVVIALLGVSCVEHRVPPTLKRNGSSGFLYGCVLIPAALMGIAEWQCGGSHASEYIRRVVQDLVKVSVWVMLSVCLSRRKTVAVMLSNFMHSFLIFCVCGLILRFVLGVELSLAVALHTLTFLTLVEIVHSSLPNSFTFGELLLLTNLCVPLLLNYQLLPLHCDTSVVANNLLAFVTLFLISLIPTSLYRVTTVHYFYSSGILLLISLIVMLNMSLPHGLLTWITQFIRGNWPWRTILLGLWATEVIICAMYVMLWRPKDKRSSTSERKLFHFFILFTYIPGLYWDVPLMVICSVVATCIWTVLESMRALHIPPLCIILNERFAVFLGAQDQGAVILTPFYLLLGQSLPVWIACLQYPSLLHGMTANVPLVAFSGVLSVGVGDTAASIVGSRYGKTKWSNCSNKTVEGTAAAIFTQIITVLVICNWSISLPCLAAIISVSLVEAFTSQIDNIVLPIYMYFLLNASSDID